MMWRLATLSMTMMLAPGASGDSPVEHQTLVDWDGRALPGFADFVARTSPASPTPNNAPLNGWKVGE